MEREDFYKKTDEVMGKFKHSKELYHSSAVFHSIVQSMVRGVNEYDIIEQLILMMEDNTKAMQNYIIKDPLPKYIDWMKLSDLKNDLKY